LAQFRADPARYAPAYDGHCAYAMSEGRTSGGMPELWQVAGGRLYLLCSKSAFDKWTSEFDARLARANANWLTVELLPAARPNPPPSATHLSGGRLRTTRLRNHFATATTFA
jgi:hypothetical protein